MARRSTLVVAAAGVLLVVAQLGVTGPATSAAPRNAGPTAHPTAHRAAPDVPSRLAADTGPGLNVARDERGRLVFAGVPARGRSDDPAVTPGTSVVRAARAHVARYGAAFGAARAGTTLVGGGATRTVSGHDLVRFAQRVGGVPVIGGELVVSLRPDRELGSMLASLSRRTAVSPARVGESAAAATARDAAARATGRATGSGLQVTAKGRWLLDPQVLGASADLGTRTVWRFEVAAGADVRRLVLVDDHTGALLMDLDLVQHVDRVVCDHANVRSSEAACTTGFARIEGGPAGAVADVNSAFDLSGAVSQFYEEIGGIDLTDALGIDVGGARKLASTVRFCPTSPTAGCPYANAFWNGQQMFYGDGFANADDVVGHEMTHGVIDQHSQLFYWGQSGAINESIADIMGEIVDHRHPSPGDSPTNWDLAEDLSIGALRNLQDPPSLGQPDRMTSALYTADAGYDDEGGVHTNSGVGNKTAYLISQGGTFNGQTVVGIDGADTTLAKTATLYLDVLESLSSGSDYADLAAVLDQSCQDLLASGGRGFTAADCDNVRRAGVATRLTTTPTNAPQPPDAAATCPTGSARRVLLDSESGAPSATFVAGPTWSRGSADWGSNATSGVDSWFSDDPATTGRSALVSAAGLALPPGQKSYLWFQQWRLLDYDDSGFYDGGTVEVDDLSTPAGPLDAAGLPWVNGPSERLITGSGNPAAGRKAFGGDSLGWVASRVDLSSFAGRSVKPRFTMNTDPTLGFIGWWLDDVQVYTCDVAVVTAARPTISGVARVGRRLTAKPGAWQPAGVTFSYRWLRGTAAIAGATGRTYTLQGADRGKRIKVRVTGQKAGLRPASATSAPTARVT